jgi:hypothetical protein
MGPGVPRPLLPPTKSLTLLAFLAFSLCPLPTRFRWRLPLRREYANALLHTLFRNIVYSSESAYTPPHAFKSSRLLELRRGEISCSKPSTISIGWLHALLHVHLRPIQLVVCQRSYELKALGSLILRSVSRLDAFSGSLVQRWLPGAALGNTTGTPALCPPRSSRTRGSASQTSNAHSG